MLRFEKDNNNECLQYFAVSIPNALLIKAEDGNVVGMVDYEVYKDSVKIFYITIIEEYKRQGYATETMTKIINENRGRCLYGDSLPSALKFWASLGVEFDEEPDEDYLTPFHLNC